MASYTYPLTMPSGPGFTSSTFNLLRRTVATVSPFTGAEQVQVFRPLGIWIFKASLPSLRGSASTTNAYAWQTFLMKLNGKQGSFYAQDPDYKSKIATSTKGVQVSGNHYVGATTVAVSPSGSNFTGSEVLFEAGDYISFGSGTSTTLHFVVNQCVAASTTSASIDFEPGLKHDAANGAAIAQGTSAVGVFALTDDIQGWSGDKYSNYTIFLDAIERQ